MTWEEAQRLMDFLLQQQEQFDARQGEFTARQAQLHESQVQSNARLARIERIVESNTLGLRQLEESHVALSKAMALMREAEIRTHERLNALILTVEKLINRNGHSSH